MSTNDDLRPRVVDVLQSARRGWTVDEVHDTVTQIEDVDVTKRHVRNVLEELVEDGQADKMPGERDGRGRPPNRYVHTSLMAEEETVLDLLKESESPPPAENIFDELGVETESVRTISDEMEDVEEDEAEAAGIEGDAFGDIAERHLDESEYIENVKSVAPALSDEDPVTLAVEMAKWCMQWVDEIGRETFEAYDTGDLDRYWRLRRRLEGLLGLADWYFVRLFRVDLLTARHEAFDDSRGFHRLPDAGDYYQPGDERQSDEFPTLPLVVDGEQDEETVARQRAAVREHLTERIQGDAVLGAFEVEDLDDAAGTDGSVADVRLPNRRNALARETTLQLFSGAAALNRGEHQYTDYDFTPERFRDYRERDAFKEGLMLSPRVFPELSRGELNKARQAAMDLRQSVENERTARNDADWEPIGESSGPDPESGPDVLFADGRVFPLVHQYPDYNNVRIYGDLVRNEVKRFVETLQMFDEHYTLVDTDLVGVVKLSMVSFLAPMVFWYLNVERDDEVPKTPDAAADDWDVDTVVPHDVVSPRLMDSVVANLLFLGLVEAPDEHDVPIDPEHTFTTFRVPRHFWEASVENKDIPPTHPVDGEWIDTTSEDEWLEYLGLEAVASELRGGDAVGVDSQAVHDIQTAGVRDLQDPNDRLDALDEVFDEDPWKPFAAACAQASVVMTYGAPQSVYINVVDLEGVDEPLFMLPRLETAVSRRSGADGDDALRRGLSWFAEDPALDHQHPFQEFGGGASDHDEGHPVLVPDIVTESDDAARMVQRMMGPKAKQKLREILDELSGD